VRVVPFVLFVVSLLFLRPAGAATVAGEQHLAAQLVKTRCALCHGADGQSLSPQYPKLAAQSAEYLIKQLFNFKTRLRPSTVMQEMTDQLTAAEIRGLADYYSRQPSQPQPAADLELAAVGRYIYFRGNAFSGVSACVTCHGVYAGGSAQLPRLAGQHASYLETQLNNFRQKLRVNDQAMHSVVAALTEMEIKAVAQYLTSQE
jgi:cytochrome c553